MRSKPEGFGAAYAETFKDQRVVDAYRYRPPYPAAVFDILASLVADEPRHVLDVGAGSGDIARHLVDFVERVDAVDFSERMIARGKQLPNGEDPRLRWINGRVEDAPLAPPYALITAGSSIHWTDWPLAFARFRSLLTRRGCLALVYCRTLAMPWDDEMRKLRARFSTRGGRRSPDVVEELERRGFFRRRGERETAPVPFSQPIDDFIQGLHSRSTFASELMGQQEADDFDRRVRALLLRYQEDGILPLQVMGTVTWGLPES
jgi:SAM-dependent methyltransferase